MGRNAEIRIGGRDQWRHSSNQRVEKWIRDWEPQSFGLRDTAVEDERRKARIERSQIEFEEMLALREQQGGLGMNSADGDFGQDGTSQAHISVKRARMTTAELRLLEKRRKFQIDRALGHVLKREATPQEMDYIARQGKV